MIANGLPMFHGAQVAIDATIVSPVSCQGQPIGNSHRHDGAALRRAHRKKCTRYAPLTAGRRCKLLVAAAEIGGRWNDEAYDFLVQLAKAKARGAPKVLRRALVHGWLRRWTGMIAYAVHDALAASLVEETVSETIGTDGPEPQIGELALTM